MQVDRAGSCGYLEESPGVRSSSRLLAMLLFSLTALVVLALLGYVVYVLRVMRAQPSGEVLHGFAWVIGALGAWGGVSIGTRNLGTGHD